MSTATTPMSPEALAPLEMPGGPVARVPSLDELRRLTEVPDRRVVFRGVDWAFYERLVDSIPEGSNIHADYDGRDVEVMANGPDHEDIKDSLGLLVKLVAIEMDIPCKGMGETTWKRPGLPRGLESDQCFYFDTGKLAMIARFRRSKDVMDYPNPDLAVEVDISRPETDRAGIYAALRVAEVWRFGSDRLVIERLTPGGTYEPVESSGFLPIRAEEIRRWIVDEGTTDETAWARRLQAWIRRKRDEGQE